MELYTQFVISHTKLITTPPIESILSYTLDSLSYITNSYLNYQLGDLKTTRLSLDRLEICKKSWNFLRFMDIQGNSLHILEIIMPYNPLAFWGS